MPHTDTLKFASTRLCVEPKQHWPLKLWLRRYRTRKQLYALLRDDPERLLCDLGLHETKVRAECRKWFWQA